MQAGTRTKVVIVFIFTQKKSKKENEMKCHK